MALLTALLAPVALSGAAAPEAPAPAALAAAPAYVQPLAPAHLATLAQDAEEEEVKWTGSLTASAIYTDGNTDTRSANVDFFSELRRENDRTTVKAYWSYQEQKGDTGEWEISERKLGASAKYDYFFDEKMYGYAQTSGAYDAQANLDLRFTVGVGLGYQWHDTDEFKLSTEAGLSYVDETFEGPSEDNSFVALRVAYSLFWQIDEAWTFLQDGEAFPSLEDKDDVNARVDSRLRGNLSASWFLQLQHIFEWDNTPAEGAERTDNKVVLSLGWTF